MNEIEKLRESEKIIDLVTELIYKKDLEGKYIRVNEPYLTYFNLKKEDVLGKTDYEIFPKQTADGFRENDKKLLESKEKSITFEEKFTSETTDNVYFQSVKRVSYDENGKANGIIGVSKDITLRKQYKLINELTKKILLKITEDESLDSLYNLIIDLMQKYNKLSIASIVLLDDDRKKIEKTISKDLPSFYTQALVGLEIGDKVGSCGTAAFRNERVIVENIDEHEYWQPFLGLTQKADLRACWSQPIVSQNNKVLGTFAIYYNKPKKPNEFELQVIESFAYLIGIAIDKKMKEKKIKEKELLLLQQSKMASMGEMLENIAHQWRQPLSVILSGITTIKLNKELNIYSEKNIDDLVERIISSSQYLSNTIDDFKNYFIKDKIQKEFKIDSLISKVEDLISQNIAKNKVTIKKDIDDLQIKSLENEILHAILNIINNAIDAHALSNIQDKLVFIKAKEEQEGIIIEVLDNAGGIDENIIDKVFEPYFTTKHKSQGTGIGLYMSREIIVKHIKGLLSVENHYFNIRNNEYKGAKFTILIPFNRDED